MATRRFATGTLRHRLRARRDARARHRHHAIGIVAVLLSCAALSPTLGLGTVGELTRGETSLFTRSASVGAAATTATSEVFQSNKRRRALLASTTTCTSDTTSRWVTHGGWILYLIGILYLFLGVAIVCDDFFTSSLETICEKLNLSEDVAGATFMAAGSSAPELFTSTMSLVSENATNELGVATIVGSAVFNIMVIVAATVLFTSQKQLKLDWKPVTRDCLFYLLAVCSVLLVMEDGRVYWWEGVTCVFMYGAYVFFMSRNERVMSWVDTFASSRNKIGIETEQSDDVERNATATKRMDDPSSIKYADASGDTNQHDPYARVSRVEEGGDGNRRAVVESTQNARRDGIDSLIPDDKRFGVKDGDENSAERSPFHPPATYTAVPLWALSLPWYFMFILTIPGNNDTAQANSRKYLASFFVSVLWISLISFGMVDLASRLGCVLDIPEVVMGTVVLAAGTSVPDALASISVARAGLGDMAVANAVGSNVFDIWLGLGLPWSVFLPFRASGYEVVNTKQLVPSVCILLGVLLVYYISIAALGFRLTEKQAYLFITVYLGFVAYAVVGVWWMDMYDMKGK